MSAFRRALPIVLLVVIPCLGTVGCKKKQDLEDAPDVSAAEMYAQAVDLIAQHRMQAATKLLQQVDLRYAPDDRDKLEPLIKLRTADAAFYQDTTVAYIDARTLYRDFATLYADHDLAPYAMFQVGMCSLKQASDPSKDQSQTLEAIQNFHDAARLYPNSRYGQAATGKIREAEAILAEHEYRVGRFYMDRKEWGAAKLRFDYLLDHYPDYVELDKVYVNLAESLLKLDNEVEAGIYLEKLLSDYPESGYRARATRLVADYKLELKIAGNGSLS